ncbi:MAG: hypothetical protein ACFE89_09775 [Candidatus Hodarchaeota archaeon]
MANLPPEDFDPLRRWDPKKKDPRDLNRSPSLDVVNLLRQLLIRVERLEEELRQLKKKLKL